MPTFGWIREDALEAFYEGTERFRDLSPPPGPTFRCPFCIATYSARLDLQNHVSSEHRVERPLLLLRGIEPAQRATIRASFSDADVFIENATNARVAKNGRESSDVPLDSFKKQLASTLDGDYKLSLINNSQKNATPVASYYELYIRVASEDQLRSVEQAFDEIIMAGEISREVIGSFLGDIRTKGTASDYAVGLAEYALGVLLKERPDTESLTTPFARYREEYGSALQKLSDYDRPLANLITNIIRFAMNDFSGFAYKTGFWELDLSNELLNNPQSVRLSGFLEQPSARKAICPVDHGTGQILTLAARMFCQDRWSPILDEECRAASEAEVLDATDRQKALAIWAASAWSLGSHESAIEPLRQIAATYPFSEWAEPFLESVTK